AAHLRDRRISAYFQTTFTFPSDFLRYAKRGSGLQSDGRMRAQTTSGVSGSRISKAAIARQRTVMRLGRPDPRVANHLEERSNEMRFSEVSIDSTVCFWRCVGGDARCVRGGGR